MRYCLFCIALLSHVLSYGQKDFESGYFIDNTGKKVSCLIKNEDWENNPKTFKYKIGDGGSVQEAGIADAQEFGTTLYEGGVFRRLDFDIDKASDDMSSLSTREAPEFTHEQAFIRVLATGKATLYIYREKGLTRYFFSSADKTATQLIYKRFQPVEGTILENNTFRQQLQHYLPCSQWTGDHLSTLRYRESDLLNYVQTYNNGCQKPVSSSDEQPVRKKLFNLTLRPGVTRSALLGKYSGNEIIPPGNTDYGSQVTARVGLEAEFGLRFNRNRWSFLLEPTFQYFKSSPGPVAKVDYKAIDVNIGLRRYFDLAGESKLYANIGYDIGLPFSSQAISKENASFDIRTVGAFALGLGYKINRYSLEANYAFTRNIFATKHYLKGEYSIFSVIFGYTLFKNKAAQ